MRFGKGSVALVGAGLALCVLAGTAAATAVTHTGSRPSRGP